jgi:hypothetical protein
MRSTTAPSYAWYVIKQNYAEKYKLTPYFASELWDFNQRYSAEFIKQEVPSQVQALKVQQISKKKNSDSSELTTEISFDPSPLIVISSRLLTEEALYITALFYVTETFFHKLHEKDGPNTRIKVDSWHFKRSWNSVYKDIE